MHLPSCCSMSSRARPWQFETFMETFSSTAARLQQIPAAPSRVPLRVPFFGEEYTIVSIAKYILSKYPESAVVSNLSTTMAVKHVADDIGARHFESAVGEINVYGSLQIIYTVIFHCLFECLCVGAAKQVNRHK